MPIAVHASESHQARSPSVRFQGKPGGGVTGSGSLALLVMGLVDATAAAQLLAVPKTWILAEARANRVPHVRLGRYVRFDPGELESWARDRIRGPKVRRTVEAG